MKFNRDASEAVAGFSIEHYDVIPDGIVLGKSAGEDFLWMPLWLGRRS